MKVRPDDFMLFFYLNEQVDTEDFFRGFLCNMILVKASDAHICFNLMLSIFHDIGISSCLSQSSTPTTSSRSGTHNGNAATYSTTKVTAPSIAYIATLVSRESDNF
jgi:hypothetical protein